MVSSGKRRGRPRAFDPSRVLDRVMLEFWTCGYSGTSLDQLSAATGVNRPSLYATFGNKKSLYISALERFHHKSTVKTIEVLQDPCLQSALRNYFAECMNLYIAHSGGSLGCPVLSSAMADAATDPETRAILSAFVQLVDDALIERFVIAEANGKLMHGADAQSGGLVIACVLHSLAIRARAGATREELTAVTEAALLTICRPSKQPLSAPRRSRKERLITLMS